MTPLRICYFGISDPSVSRSRIYMDALRDQGMSVIECFDTSPGLRKFARLWHKHRQIRDQYDVLVVGYPSHLAVPFARLVSRTRIVLDAGWSLYEGDVISRGFYRHNPLKRFKVWLIDRMAYQFADCVLLETDRQIDFYVRLVHGSRRKCVRLYTGTDERKFFPMPDAPKRPRFTVLFRGVYNPEAGIESVVEAARLLRDDDINFLIMSPRFVPAEPLPANVEFDPAFHDQDTLRARMASCHLTLGQLAYHERLDRTIPHKAFESAAMGLPYLTARTNGILELFTDGESVATCVPGDPVDLARVIRRLKDDPEGTAKLGWEAHRVYTERASQALLGRELVAILKRFV